MRAVALALVLALAGSAASAHGLGAASAEACPDGASPVMILGTYHMSNPGLDAQNIEADDVLSTRRQAEIAALVEALAGFAPTKVMLESAFARPVAQERYERYLAGEHELGRNETEQIGYRLARRMGLERVHPVDYPMWMNGLTYDEMDLSRRPSPAAEPTPRDPSEEELVLRRSTVAEYLVRLNDPDRIRREHRENYMPLFDDDPASIAIYQRTDTLLNWYKRNFRIWANVVRGTERPGDRVLLLIGSGHLAILRDLATDMPGFCLVEPGAYLAAAAG